jgi:hypothetical protein
VCVLSQIGPVRKILLMEAEVQTDRQTDRQRDRETDRQTDRQGYVAVPLKCLRYWPIETKIVKSVANICCGQITSFQGCHSNANRNTA